MSVVSIVVRKDRWDALGKSVRMTTNLPKETREKYLDAYCQGFAHIFVGCKPGIAQNYQKNQTHGHHMFMYLAVGSIL